MAENEVGQANASRTSGKGRTTQLVIVAILMAGEGVGIFLVTKAMQPKPISVLAEPDGGEGGSTGSGAAALAEVELAQCRPTNNLLGRIVTYQLRVSVLVASADEERVKELADTKRGRIRDRVNFVIRSADPKHLDEPGLETIKRRLLDELERIFDNEGLIRDVLIPELLQSRPGV